jgi:putative endonuclease
MIWYVYIAKCRDDSLYTGITTDIKRRETEHNLDNKKGAKSLRGRRPVKIIYFEKYITESEAKKREVAIKNWHKSYKLKLISNNT